MSKLSITLYALYFAFGCLTSELGLGLSDWGFWLILVNLTAIDICSYMKGLQDGK